MLQRIKQKSKMHTTTWVLTLVSIVFLPLCMGLKSPLNHADFEQNVEQNLIEWARTQLNTRTTLNHFSQPDTPPVSLNAVNLELPNYQEIQDPWSAQLQQQRIEQINARAIERFQQAKQTLNEEIDNIRAYIRSNGSAEDVVKTHFFVKHTQERLPKYITWFKQAAAQHKLDWRLLAAISYQESLWDPEAVSPTGVKGLMMLTKATAAEMGIADRSNPKDSIFGGAAYFKKIHKRLPKAIREPDRTQMALAAYNAGYGHMVDARRLTRAQGGLLTQWQDVKKRLPLLQDPNYYNQLTHGYSMGARQAIKYVQHVESFHQILQLSSLGLSQPRFANAGSPNKNEAAFELAMF